MTSDESYADTRDMLAVHTMFRREYALMPELVRSVMPGDKARSEIVADHIALMNGALHHHHAAEDKHIWPKLLERAAETIHPIVRSMQDQHEKLEEIIVESDVAVKQWRASATSGWGTALVEALNRLNVLVAQHMDLEEKQILPVIEKQITAAEWDQMVEDAAANTPPEHLPLIFGMVMYEGDPEVVEQILSGLPPDVAPVLKERAPRVFAEYSARVHGNATPARIKA